MKTATLTPRFASVFDRTPEKGKVFTKPSLTDQSHDVTIRQILDKATRLGLPLPNPSQDRLFFDEQHPQPDFSLMSPFEQHDYALHLRSKIDESQEKERILKSQIDEIKAQEALELAVQQRVDSQSKKPTEAKELFQ